MKKDLDEKICNDFPLLFRYRGLSSREHTMGWGFPGAGWFKIIYDTSSKIEKILKKYKEENLGKELASSAQVKNKFGFLRWYVDFPEDFPPKLKKAISIAVCEAEEASVFICESCGMGRLDTIGMTCRCEECQSKDRWGKEE